MVQNSSVQIPTVSTVSMFRPLLLLLLLTFLPSGLCLEIQGVSLAGGGGEYVEMGAKSGYVLRCDFRNAYDEQVTKVRWKKFGLPVYTWAINSTPSVFPPLLGQVDVAPESSPHNLHLTHIAYSLAGNYTCEVTSTSTSSSTSSTSTSDPFALYVVDGSSGEYTCTVQLLEAMMNSTNSTDDRDKYEVEGATDDVDFEPPECTLVWSLSTPAIFPRPNITCGYFSFDYDDVTFRLPAGLTLHKFSNESWQASFRETHVQVKHIPVHHRLACTVRIPGTSYKQIVRADDDFLVDNLIDAAGCPGLEGNESLNLVVDVGAATRTCRGDVLPEDRTGLATATVRCPEGHTAVFPDGRGEGGWELSLTCAENDLGWRTVPSDPQDVGILFSTDNLPHCQPGGVSGGERRCDGVILLTTFLLTTLLFV